MNTIYFQPGLVPGLTNDAYQKADAISKSKLDAIAPPKTPLHYWAKHVDPDRKPEERTEALILGDAIHVAALEPDDLLRRVVPIPADAPSRPSIRTRRAKDPSKASLDAIDYWDDFLEEHKGKSILKLEDFAMVKRVRDRLHSHPLAAGLLYGGTSEQSYFALDRQTGARIKCRLDYDLLEAEGMIVDVKSTEDASPDGFGRSATKYRYDIQAEHYEGVLNDAFNANTGEIVRTFAFIAVEKEWPHAIGVYFRDRSMMVDDETVKERRRDLDAIIHHTAADYWPDYTPTTALPLRVGYRRK